MTLTNFINLKLGFIGHYTSPITNLVKQPKEKIDSIRRTNLDFYHLGSLQ